MQSLIQRVEDLGYICNHSQEVVVDSSTRIYIADAHEVAVDIAAGITADILVVHNDVSKIDFRVANGAKLNLVELYLSDTKAFSAIHLTEGAISKSAIVALGASQGGCEISLDGSLSHASIDTLQLASEEQESSLRIDMRHCTTDSSSVSLSKCVASGSANMSFSGLVYVAKDAQRTAAEQNTRSLFLSDSAHIKAEPQLEIYADDVKCSHGATVGQIDTDAILYMRQRGLSESQARRLQMEGFVADIVESSSIDDIKQEIMAQVVNKNFLVYSMQTA